MDQISLERCRELIGDGSADLTDKQVQRLRRELYELAEVVVDAFCSLDGGGYQDGLYPSGDIVDQLQPGYIASRVEAWQRSVKL